MEGPFSPSRHLAILGDALISNVLFESWLQRHLSILGQRSNLERPVRVMASACWRDQAQINKK